MLSLTAEEALSFEEEVDEEEEDEDEEELFRVEASKEGAMLSTNTAGSSTRSLQSMKSFQLTFEPSKKNEQVNLVLSASVHLCC